MDQLLPRETDLEVEIESGLLDDKCDRTENTVSSNWQTDKNMNRVWSGYLSSDGSEKSTDDSYSLIDISKLGEIKNETLPLIRSGEKHQKYDCKALKPPRPPKGPSLTANDRKLVKEIAQLAMRKRLRVERMKKLKTMRDAKRPSSCYSTFAITVTFIFFLFVISQGLSSSTNATLSSAASPAPAVLPKESLVSVQFFKDFAPFEQNDPGPTSFRRLEKQISGADLDDDGRNHF